MIEVARREARSRTRAQPQHYGWGIVDVVLGVLMLPFAVWVFVIEGMVRAVAALGNR